jgi:hypothetical protein
MKEPYVSRVLEHTPVGPERRGGRERGRERGGGRERGEGEREGERRGRERGGREWIQGERGREGRTTLL